MQKRIPRDEVTKISEWVTRAALSIDPKLECITGGSYRRGNPDCGDVDIMITRNDSDGTTHLGNCLHLKYFIKKNIKFSSIII